jgi:hypothetical protein
MPTRPQLGRLGGKGRIAAPDRRLHLLQARARLQAELVQKRLAPPLVGLQRFCLATGAVERDHQLPVQLLARRVLRDQVLELRDQLGAATRPQLRLNAQLNRRQSFLFHLEHELVDARFPVEVGERAAPPERECVAEHSDGPLRLVAGQ